MPRERSVLVTIFWRDIPAQVNAQVGRERHQILLPNRFQRAVDRAKRKARIYTSSEDIAQWRRETKPFTGDPEAAARAEIEAIEVAYDADRIRRLVRAAGVEADVDTTTDVDRRELAALEELDDE